MSAVTTGFNIFTSCFAALAFAGALIWIVYRITQR